MWSSPCRSGKRAEGGHPQILFWGELPPLEPSSAPTASPKEAKQHLVVILKLKLQFFGHLMGRTDSLKKDPGAGKD